MRRLMILAVIVFLSIKVTGQEIKDIIPAPIDRETVIDHKGFSMSYNSSYVLPSWVAYTVSKAQVNKNEKVKEKYQTDPKIKTRSADKKDYKKSGYIMAQFVNYLDLKPIEGAIEESFYMSNIVAMKQAFYIHVWLKFEDMIRLWSSETSKLHVITGPILSDSPFPTLGKSKVSVPSRFYKIVYDPDNQKAIAFIFKNGTVTRSFKSNAVSIDELEEITGIDFFASLEDGLEKKLESGLNKEAWDFEVLE